MIGNRQITVDRWTRIDRWRARRIELQGNDHSKEQSWKTKCHGWCNNQLRLKQSPWEDRARVWPRIQRECEEEGAAKGSRLRLEAPGPHKPCALHFKGIEFVDVKCVLWWWSGKAPCFKRNSQNTILPGFLWNTSSWESSGPFAVKVSFCVLPQPLERLRVKRHGRKHEPSCYKEGYFSVLNKRPHFFISDRSCDLCNLSHPWIVVFFFFLAFLLLWI